MLRRCFSASLYASHALRRRALAAQSVSHSAAAASAAATPPSLAEGPDVPIPQNKPGAVPPYPEKVVRLVDELSHLSLMEVDLFRRCLCERFGMNPDTVMSAMPGAGAGAAAAEEEAAKPAAEEKTAFNVKVTKFDAKAKIKVIKEVRDIAKLGLKEAKDFVEGLPGVLKKDLKKEEAEKIIAQLKEAGAEAELD